MLNRSHSIPWKRSLTLERDAGLDALAPEAAKAPAPLESARVPEGERSPDAPLQREAEGAKAPAPAPTHAAAGKRLAQTMQIRRDEAQLLAQTHERFPYLEVQHLSESCVKNETVLAARLLVEAAALRTKYQAEAATGHTPAWEIGGEGVFGGRLPPPSPYTVACRLGVLVALDADGAVVFEPPSAVAFQRDYARLCAICVDGPVKTLSYKRMRMLHNRFKLHKLLNERREETATQDDPRDFSNVVKVDTHIHLSAAMTSKHLFDFIKRKAVTDANLIVHKTRDGVEQTLSDVFASMGLKAEEFTLDALDVHADNTFQRFDNFNNKYNPFGKAVLRDVFLKSSNIINGRYYAELTQELFGKLEKSHYRMAEYRVSIYGRHRSDWDELAKWIVDHKLYSPHQRWVIQVPRIYFVYRKLNLVQNFQELLDNIFQPLFEATIDPASHPEVHYFLQQISGFDSVDDESRPESDFSEGLAAVSPAEYTTTENPPYAYWMYYMYANIVALNHLRQLRGMRTFTLRPHCGESGSVTHLCAAYLCAQEINHGIQLAQSPPLQYLYYLAQIGLAVSPLSNNKLFVAYNDNPFKKLFVRGLNVSLSSDDPLQFHFTENPLLEEYEVAAQRWNLNAVDLCEIAANSVRQSGFEPSYKARWLGPHWEEPGAAGNDVAFSNVPAIRAIYRQRVLTHERAVLAKWAALKTEPVDKYERADFMNPNDLSNYARLTISAGHPGVAVDISEQTVRSCQVFHQASALREKYLWMPSTQASTESSHYVVRLDDGIFLVYEGVCIGEREFIGTTPLTQPPTLKEFIADYQWLTKWLGNQILARQAGNRLKIMEKLFRFHSLLNGTREARLVTGFTKTDLNHVHKVDNYIHLQWSMTDRHLLKFINKKLKEEPGRVVLHDGDNDVTLRDVFDGMGVSEANFTLDSLRVDDFIVEEQREGWQKLSQARSRLIKTFLEVNNSFGGAYFASLVKEVTLKRQRNLYNDYEYVLPLYGTSLDDWHKVAQWVIEHNLDTAQTHWIIEFPHSYAALRADGTVDSFQQVLTNWFKPLFDVTFDPTSDPQLHEFLKSVTSFSCPQPTNAAHLSDPVPVMPEAWDALQNPPYAYALYHVWANVRSLNSLRHAKGLTPLQLRPVSGRSGSALDLSAAFLLADGIFGGVDLAHNNFLQYLYMSSQVGVMVAPLSDNARSIPYKLHPLQSFFTRGLKVSLASDTPLHLHMTTDSLAEEYAIAAQMWKFSVVDLSELSRNSVLNSGLPRERKRKYLGEKFDEPGVNGNDATRTNVPSIRVQFRCDVLDAEQRFVNDVIALAAAPQRSVPTVRRPPVRRVSAGRSALVASTQ